MITAPTPSETSNLTSVIRNMPIRQRIDWLMDHAHRHSMEFQSPESYQARRLYIDRPAPNLRRRAQLHG